MGDMDESGDKTHRETRDVNNNAISVANEYDTTDSPLVMVGGTTYEIDTSGDVAEIFILPIGTDVQLGMANPVVDHDLIRDGVKESVGCVLLDSVFIRAVGDGIAYLRRLKL